MVYHERTEEMGGALGSLVVEFAQVNFDKIVYKIKLPLPAVCMYVSFGHGSSLLWTHYAEAFL